MSRLGCGDRRAPSLRTPALTKAPPRPSDDRAPGCAPRSGREGRGRGARRASAAGRRHVGAAPAGCRRLGAAWMAPGPSLALGGFGRAREAAVVRRRQPGEARCRSGCARGPRGLSGSHPSIQASPARWRGSLCVGLRLAARPAPPWAGALGTRGSSSSCCCLDQATRYSAKWREASVCPALHLADLAGGVLWPRQAWALNNSSQGCPPASLTRPACWLALNVSRSPPRS